MTDAAAPPPGPAGDLFAGGGEAGALMADFDWSATPLGPVSGWPAGLRWAVRTILASRFPMVLTWGPQYTQFYNDAYAPFIGAKHPAIGEDIRVTLAEGWAALAGPVEHAMTAREASWLPRLPLLLERAGYREETYFTVSHAPAFDDDGSVGGMLGVCTEVTGEVVAERRQQLLHDLSTAGASLGDEDTVLAALATALAGDPLDVPFAAVYLTGPDGRLQRATTVGIDADLLPASVPDAVRLPRTVNHLGVAGGFWRDPVADAVVLPLAATAGEEQLGVLLAATSPNLLLDAEYRTFLELTAGQVAGGLLNARTFEAERRRAEALAELDRAKTAFFSDVSHELRTPLTLLLGPISDVLAESDEPLGPAAREQLTMAMRNGQRLQRLVNDLLEFASIEAGRGAAVRVPVDLAAYTTELAGLLRAAAERAGLRLTVDCPPLPRTVAVDPRMWEKVVVNLLSNAVKYTFVGTITVTLRAAGDDVELTVSDTGVGIPAGELPRVFDRFHRVPGSAGRNREGSGLGLALARELVLLHGGSIEVASEPGRGTSFTVRVPFGAPDVPAARTADPARLPTAAARGTADTWVQDVAPHASAAPRQEGTATVLVVDDNGDMRAYLRRLLAPHYSVRTVADGEEALAAVGEELPDVVVTDVMMPRVDGFELLRRLRADPATAGVPVVMLTARAGQEAAVEGFTAGVDDYLAKPFQAPELLARVRVAIERAAGRVPPVAGGRPAGDAEPVVPPSGVPVPRVEDEVVPPAAEPAEDAGEDAEHSARWRFPATVHAVPALRRRLRALLTGAGLEEDQTYDLLLAACEAATNAVEHAQQPSQPYVDVTVDVTGDEVEITVRDYGQWRERVPSMDRGRGSTLMSAFAEVNATPSPEGTTVVIRARRAA
ncbi:ATP-binding protein [Modestobacter sp. NPDC049651]|uniref:ATP-binding protein n=1 Tax=unclassified Modestobacter TaxID=2643866 RepID=UPI0033F01F67